MAVQYIPIWEYVKYYFSCSLFPFSWQPQNSPRRSVYSASLRYLLFLSEGTYSPLATLPLVEAQAASHARRAPSSRSKLGGSRTRHHERHAAHSRLRREPRLRRAPHARFLQRLRRILQRALLPLQTTHLRLLPPPHRRSPSRRRTLARNIPRSPPRRRPLRTPRPLPHLPLRHRLQTPSRSPSQSRIPRHVLWPSKHHSRSRQAGRHRIRSLGPPRRRKARPHRPRNPPPPRIRASQLRGNLRPPPSPHHHR